MAWKQFRFGLKLGEPWPDQQFPLDHVDEFYKQVIPDMFETQVPSLLAELLSRQTQNPTVDNFATPADELGGAILVGHSQSAGFPTQAVLKGKGGIKGIIQLETGCFANLTADQIITIAEVPMLIMVGDHFGQQPDPICVKEMEQIDAAGGDITFVSLPDVGLTGNSHMFMQDQNNLDAADLVITWISEHVDNAL